MSDAKDVLLFGALALIWGTAFTAIEIGLETLPPLLFAAARLDIAAIVFAGVVLLRRLEWRPRTKADLALVLSNGLLVIGAHFAFSFVGQSYVSSSVAAIVLSFTPIITPLIAIRLLATERIVVTDVVGLGAGLAGVIAIAVAGGTFDGQLLGIGLLLASAVVFALGSVLTERWTPVLPTMSLHAWSMGIGAVFLHATAYAHSGASIRSVTWTPSAVAALAYLGIVATAGGFLLYFALLSRTGATNVSLINYATPVVATVFGATLLGEQITAATVAGFALIVIGFALCNIRPLWRLARSTRSAKGGGRPLERGEICVRGNVYTATHDSQSRLQPSD
ncbi:DMT family transporter [Natronorubrum texcoconense]|uniref:Permease of the drug/metabolite transporter (DMT) superfamily n=1 Tax=Natronorubrum texcoconense TaxID=1095776 RepID=A0A1G8YLA9_9EURY|nr:DMT family transporter [Natronorubrum texcoconense]SDK03551.1 Permease of the drug/metabolite transporter (DMT) superfamily [Natronorubrum texcoconense]